MIRWFGVVLSFWIWLPAALAAAPDEPFAQETVKRLMYKDLDIAAVQDALVDSQGRLHLLTDNALLLFTGDSPRKVDDTIGLPVSPGMKMTVAPGRDNVFGFAGPEGLYLYASGGKAVLMPAELGPVYAIVASARGDVWVGCENGLFVWKRGSQKPQRIEAVQGPVSALAWNESQGLAAGTPYALYRFDGSVWRHTFIPGQIDASVTALAFDEGGRLWIGNRDCINIQNPDQTFERVSGLHGLPYNRITCLTSGSGNTVWIGTEKGAIRWRDGRWNYYYGPRWHPGERVLRIALDENHVTWLVTDEGLAQLTFEMWSLKRKAAHYESLTRPRHDRHGLVADCALREFGNLESFFLKDNDNDGLWTSIYLGALCFQYAVTKDPEVKQKAWRHYEAMEMLERITGIPGFIARSYVIKGEEHSKGGEWHPTPDGEWTWKGDTSSDEMVGHLFVYPLVYDLLAETPEEKERIKGLVSRIMNYVVDNGYYLLDLDGKPTLWGVWAPEKLNHDPEWTVERGLNSLQMLSFLLAAHHVTGEPKFLDCFNDLVENHGYADNAINQKIELPSENNHSDDELAFLPYYILFRYLDTVKDETVKAKLRLSLDRAWKIEEPEKSSLWNVIYGSSGAKEFGLEDALWTLREWPLELIDWPAPNSHRLDIRIHPDLTRAGRKQSVAVLPPDERRVMRWNGNPFELDGGGGHGEDDPGAWLLPYWMAVYHGFIEYQP